ncbi:MAG TPA: A/G-specific adenine glycosylase [Nitrospirota bacterium]|nr:A/G-specific adenine glycosylase [Nitrospirota bacterium]
MQRKTTTIRRRKNDALITAASVRIFRKKVYEYYEQSGRSLPWRKNPTPYRVVVSEVMLQQTQVERVIEKFPEFLNAIPNFNSLARAPLLKLLRVWSGMGYNRRALALKSLAQQVVHDHHGKLPCDPEYLRTLPGIGKYTAGAIAAFAFNKPVVFMDTNIRRVFIHEFFSNRDAIHDEEIVPIVEQTLDTQDPRRWYNALMDYGTMLKREHGNPNRKSVHYIRQRPFENSNRQVRGKILKVLVAESPLRAAQIVSKTGMAPERVQANLLRLEVEGFIRKRGMSYSIG